MEYLNFLKLEHEHVRPLLYLRNILDSLDKKRKKGENPNAMAISTLGKQIKTRMVLCKTVLPDENIIRFFSNYNSAKGIALNENPNISGVFYWDHLGIQIRFIGEVKKSTRKISEDYFATRNRLSQIGAWASQQSSTINGYQELIDKFKKFELKFQNTKLIPCPSYWGGWDIHTHEIEFWRNQPNRLHQRLLLELNNNTWQSTWLSP